MNPIAAHGNSGWTQATKTASLMCENLSSRSESSSTLDYKLIAQLPFNIKLQHCGDHQLVPQGWTTSTPGEQCRTQVPTQAGSGDLFPKLGEETAPSLVQDQRAASRRSWQCYKVLVIVETKPLWCSVLLTSFPLRFWRPSPPPSFSEHSSTVATTTTATGSSLQFPTLPWRLLTMVIPTKTRCWQFLTGESPLAYWFVLLLAACTLKQVKTGHLICP